MTRPPIQKDGAPGGAHEEAGSRRIPGGCSTSKKSRAWKKHDSTAKTGRDPRAAQRGFTTPSTVADIRRSAARAQPRDEALDALGGRGHDAVVVVIARRGERAAAARAGPGLAAPSSASSATVAFAAATASDAGAAPAGAGSTPAPAGAPVRTALVALHEENAPSAAESTLRREASGARRRQSAAVSAATATRSP